LARLLAVALVVGVLSAAAASVFVGVMDWGQEQLFLDLPNAWGWEGAPWWWAALLLFIGAGLIALARRLPGATGQGPLSGFHFDDPLSMVPSVILAALATLCFGFALGPEAPLIVLGTAVGAIFARRASPQARKAAMFLGGAAGIGAVFGNPFVTGFMILEFAALGIVPAVMITPAFVALASGYLVQIGIWGLTGFGLHTLAVPGLPAYPEILPGDIALSLLVAVVAGIVAVIARTGGVRVDGMFTPRPLVGLAATAAVTATVLFVAQVGFGVAQDQILFSGNSGMAGLVQETSVTAVIVILLGKMVVYGVALGGGTRGGPVFPATFLGVAVAVLLVLIAPSTSLSPMVAAGVAASASAMLRLPATSAMLGALLVTGSGAAIAPFAIFGAVIGFAIRTVADRRQAPPPAST
jgi:H+/Cl- antiporter ClcA